ncbi:MAG TPA: hypothetical protein VMD27_13920 [Candidatus Aquilonibacter sp.]|nr:hypothetical protein [Candidatus Aquilonibacter sp.]
MSRRRKILIFAGIILGAAILIPVIRHYQLRSSVASYIAGLKARGEPMEISEALLAPVPPGSNGVEAARAAFALLTPGSFAESNLPPMMQMVAPGRAMIGWQQPEVRGPDFTNSWSNVMAAAAANQAARALLMKAAAYPAIDFQLDYTKAYDLRLPQYRGLRQSMQGLAAAVICDLHDGNTASAATNICTMLALDQAIRGDRTEFSQVTRGAFAEIAASATWELLQVTNVTDAELAGLQTHWERLEFIKEMENADLMERAFMESEIPKMRASAAEFYRMFNGPGGFYANFVDEPSGEATGKLGHIWIDAKTTYAMSMWRFWWSYSDELQALKQYQIFFESLRAVETNQVFYPAYTNMENRLHAIVVTDDSEDWWLSKLDIPDARWFFSEINVSSENSFGYDLYATIIRTTMRAEATKRIVITAIALKRFQLQHGNYPENLSELTPEFLTTVPLDPVDGQPLRYHRNANGTYLLYSIGENGVDDGGNPSLEKDVTDSNQYWPNLHALDWVWPQPAAPAEVQNFYNHPPK